MESEYPVNGIRPGTFTMPVAVCAESQVCGQQKNWRFTYNKEQFHRDHPPSGILQSASQRYPDVQVGVPIDASNFDLLVIGRLLDANELEKQGLSQNASKAREQFKKDIAYAASFLAHYRVSKDELEALLDRIFNESEPTIKAAIFA